MPFLQNFSVFLGKSHRRNADGNFRPLVQLTDHFKSIFLSKQYLDTLIDIDKADS